MVDLPLWKIWVRQLGLLPTDYNQPVYQPTLKRSISRDHKISIETGNPPTDPCLAPAFGWNGLDSAIAVCCVYLCPLKPQEKGEKVWKTHDTYTYTYTYTDTYTYIIIHNNKPWSPAFPFFLQDHCLPLAPSHWGSRGWRRLATCSRCREVRSPRIFLS